MKKYLHIFLIVFLLWAHTALAATRTFVGDGASHNWSATGAWVEGIVPTAADDVVFSSNTIGSILVVDGTSVSPSLCKSFNTTNYTRTISFVAGKEMDIGTNSAAAFKLTAGVSFPSYGGLFNFVSTATGNTITNGGYAPIYAFSGVGGSWLLQDAVLTATNITFSAGTLDLNGNNFSPSIFNSLTGSTRVLNMGSGTVTVPSSGSWQVGDLSTGLTINGGTSTFTPSFAAGTLTLGDQTYHDYLQNATGAFNPTLHGTPTFNNFSATAPNVSSSITLDGGITVNGTLTLSGNSFSQNTRFFLKSFVYGTQAFVVANGALALSRIDIKDIAASGSASWNLAAVTGLSGDCGNNTGITFTAPATIFAVMTTSGGIGAVSVLPWKTTSGGAVAARTPLPQDTARFDANSFSTTGITVTCDVLRVGPLDFTGATNSPTLALNSSQVNSTEIYGSLTLISAMTLTGTTKPLNFEGGAGTSNITTAGKSIPWPTSFGSNRTIAPLDALTSTNTLTVFDFSTFNTNGFSHQFTTITLSGGTTNVNDSLTGTGAITVNSSGQPAVLNVNAHLNGATFSESLGTVNLSSQINSTGAITLSGGATNDSGNSGEYKGTTLSCTGGTHTLRKLTLSSTFAASATCAYTLPAGANGTYATSWNESNISGSTTINGRLVRASGSYTVSGNSCTFGD